jgi:8-oxo-dGTP pyrophosphatase MutT (NUDIX family)
MTGEADAFDPGEVVRRVTRFDGLRWDVRTDDVRLPSGEVVTRDYVVHPGAVGIIAMDDRDRVLLVRQYRHPTGYYLWEPPAGLMDIAGESALATAQRELLEETGCVARDWHVLIDWFNSPGGSSEGFRCFLARGVEEHGDGRPSGEGEEADMPLRWVPIDEAVRLVFSGGLHNPTAVSGVMAAALARRLGWQNLRPADAPWQERENLQTAERVWLP